MANNRIQIKRSVSNSTVTGLSNGELAFTQAGNTLHIGLPDGSGVLRIGGAMVPGTLTANQALVANSTSGIDRIIVANAIITAITANSSLGSQGQVLTSNGTTIYWSNNAVGGNTQIQFNDSGMANSSAALTFNKVSNTLTISNTVNAATLSVGSSIVANTTRLLIGNTVGIEANGSIGSAGQVLTSNGTTAYWSSTGSSISTVTAGSGLTGGGTGGSVTLDVGAGNGISVSADAISVNPGSTLTVNSTGVHVNTNLSITNLTLSGNLDINGTLTTVDSINLSVTDSLIELARGNATDVVDIGFFGNYNNGTARYTGLAWDASAGRYELFANTTEIPSGTINTTSTGYTTAILRAFLVSGGLVTNNTVTNITANSTHSVALIANTLTLSTALVGTSGGTGKSTMTNQAILVGNTTNGYNELALGASGFVLQSNGSALVYDYLDGGTF